MSLLRTSRVDDAVELMAELLGPDPRVRPATELADDEPAGCCRPAVGSMCW